MSLTGDLFKAGLNAYVPFADKIPGLSTQSPEVSKKQLKNHLKVARSMEKAIESGKLDASFAPAVQNMKNKSIKDLSQSNLSERRYIYDQLEKTAPLLEAVIPGSGIVAVNASRVKNAQNLYRFRNEAPSLKDQAVQIASFAAPIIFASTSHLIMPVINEYITKSVVITGGAAVIGTTLFLDAINYLRNN